MLYHAMRPLSTLENLLSNNAIVKRKLRRLFQEKWAAKIPYADKDLTLEKFALMTRFINFNRRFYDAIPFDVDSTNIEKSFEALIDLIINGRTKEEMLAEITHKDTSVTIVSENKSKGKKCILAIFF